MGIETTGSGGADTVVRLSLLFFSIQVPSVEIGYLLLLLVVVGLPFLCWLLYLWVQSDLDASGRRDPIAGQEGAIADYLARLDAGLHLPAGTRRDVVNEIAGHLAQSVATLEAAGATHADAVREALARLGPAEPLARELRSAQQTRRRLFAGAGGGVFGATAGFGLGVLFAGLALLPVMLFAVMIASALDRVLPGASDRFDASTTALRWLWPSMALLVTGRVSTRMAAGLSRRDIRWFGRVIAAVGVPTITVIVVGGIRATWAWIEIPAALALPAGFAAGALTADRPVRWPSRRGRLAIWLSLAAIIVIVPLVLAPPDAGRRPAATLDRVAPPAPVTLVPQTAGAGSGMYTDCWRFDAPVVTCTLHGATGPAWTDLRMEAWRATRGSYPEGVDPRATAPLLVAPVSIGAEEITATIDPGFHRSGNAWWFVLTGVAPDGVRYRLTDGDGATLDWQPTLLEWLRAPD